jgi:hypothetical protein
MASLPCRRLVCAALLLLYALSAAAQRGAIVVGRNLAELTTQADTIVVARVVFTKVEPHPQFHNLQTVVVTLSVSETWKGVPQNTMSFRQFIWDPRDIADSAAYRRGDEVLLLLNRVNEYGLTSPAGLNQGRFEIRRDAAGKAYALNGHGNEGLFTGLTGAAAARLSVRSRAVVEQSPRGPMPLDELRNLVREMVSNEARAQ